MKNVAVASLNIKRRVAVLSYFAGEIRGGNRGRNIFKSLTTKR